jgi:dipeptidyl aminopeptidase/acylaminoacyl peptidase
MSAADNNKAMLAPFGLWPSPITPGSLAEGKRLDGVCWDSDGRTLVWLEGRSGKGVLVAQTDDDAPRDLTAELNVRDEVGYVGGDFTVHGGYVYFVVRKTGRIFRQPLAGGEAQPITPEFGQASSPAVSPDGQWVAYVHHDEGEDRLAVVDAAGSRWPQILAAGHDFYMQPRWSPDGRHMAWIAWDHPNMPWDGARLYLAVVEYPARGVPTLGEPQLAAGGDEVAVFQPEFTHDGKHVLFVADNSGWGRLTSREISGGSQRSLTPDGLEYGAPAWIQDLRTYAVSGDGRTVLAVGNDHGFQQLRRIDLTSGDSSIVAELGEYSEISSLAAAPRGDKLALIASNPTQPPRVIVHDFSQGRTRTVARSAAENVPRESLARCEAISWTTAEGETAHGLFYAPAGKSSPSDGKPPLIVLIHGGPTSQVKAGWRADAQFFATRGYAVLYVNYRGSTGYGRQYMLRLRGNWGVCDVEDAVSGAKYLADAGRVDGERMVIMGGSAGGFTVLQTMVVQPDAFAAGVSLYGVANQFGLAADTHKFESRYTDSLLGPLPEAAALYRERSPVFHAAKIRRPLAVFQGSVDTVVPQNQSDEIVAALKRNGTPHVYHIYEGEGHGWRQRETIEHFYNAVDGFLRQHVIFA